jgi:hypothetical protein
MQMTETFGELNQIDFMFKHRQVSLETQALTKASKKIREELKLLRAESEQARLDSEKIRLESRKLRKITT